MLKISLCALGLPNPLTSLCVTYLWVYVKDKVYASPLLANIDGMQKLNNSCNQHGGLRHAEAHLSGNSYQLHNIRAAVGGDIKHL